MRILSWPVASTLAWVAWCWILIAFSLKYFAEAAHTRDNWACFPAKKRS